MTVLRYRMGSFECCFAQYVAPRFKIYTGITHSSKIRSIPTMRIYVRIWSCERFGAPTSRTLERQGSPCLRRPDDKHMLGGADVSTQPLEEFQETHKIVPRHFPFLLLSKMTNRHLVKCVAYNKISQLSEQCIYFCKFNTKIIVRIQLFE